MMESIIALVKTRILWVKILVAVPSIFANDLAAAQSIDRPMYMGTASTGEQVFYYGGRAQCGNLPKTDRCWRNPMIMYQIGKEKINTVLDCDKRIFRDVWSVTYGKKYKNFKPSSSATEKNDNHCMHKIQLVFSKDQLLLTK